jgi:hypothetical protein
MRSIIVVISFSSPIINYASPHGGVRGSGCIDPSILNPGIRCRCVVSFTPRPLNPRGKSPQYPLGRRLGGPQSRPGRCVEKQNLARTGTRTPISQPLNP